jgi:co-chaperonin GroES (HSP10)
MSLKGKTDIFQGTSREFTGIDPLSIKLISDRVLIRDLQDAEKEGSIVIPEAYRDRGVNDFGTMRIGVVVAVGPGDRFIEHGVTDEGEVRRTLITCPCMCAYAMMRDGSRWWFDIRNYCRVELKPGEKCPACDGSGRIPICVPPQVWPGQKVLYDRRKEAEIYLDGQRYLIVHAEQAVVAVLEEEDAGGTGRNIQ